MKLQNTVQTNLNDPIPVLLSKLWVFLSLNYIFCDVLTSMEMAVLKGLLEGNIAGIEMTQGFLLMAGISLEIPFLMLLLSIVLPYKANRITNIAAAILMIVYQFGSFMVGSEMTLHYMFFSGVEILGNAVILVLALRWQQLRQAVQHDI